MDLLLPPGHELPEWASPIEYGEAIVSGDITNAMYHGSRALVSKSALDVFARSPAHYLHYLQTGFNDDDPREKEPEALLVGSAYHALVLEPEVFERSYVLLPDFGDMRSSKNRDLRDNWLSERRGFKGLTEPQWTMIHEMRESLLRHKRLRRILETGRPEVTIAVQCPHTGLVRKVRFDWLSEIEGIGLDLKSARDGRPNFWKREAANRRYEVQDGYYVDTAQKVGLDIDTLAFGVTEKIPPYVTELYTLGPTSRIAGEQRFFAELEGIAHCCETGEFPGYSNGEVTEIDLPGWAVADVATTP